MKRQVFALFPIFIFLVAACQIAMPELPTPTPTPPPTPTPTPADYLRMASEAMAGIQSVQFSLDREGNPVILEPTLGLQFVSATGSYEAPDRVHAKVKTDIGGNLLELDLLWLPEGNFMSNPLTGTFGPQPEGIPLNPVAIFEPAVGTEVGQGSGALAAKLHPFGILLAA